MKISKLLASRQALLRQTQLANLAYAYVTLRRLAQRIAAANLHGLVRLRSANPAEERFWATLVALEGHQSVIEEHFADPELIELADALGYATDGEFDELDFRMEELDERFIVPIRQMLDHSGVVFDQEGVQSRLPAENGD